MTKEEAIHEIEKVFEPAFANYIITALTEGATSSDEEQQTCKDCIIREEAIRIAEQGQIQGYEWQFKKLCNLPSVTPSYNSINTELKPCEDVLDEIIAQIEQTRDKDKIAEYPYNRCIRIIEEAKNKDV